MVVASISGIRGIFNQDLLSPDVVRYCRNFVALTNSAQVLLARDTRPTGNTISKAVAGAILREGADVLDFGVISTPAAFRESRLRKRPAIIVTASHNEPEWNGLKFLVNGRGIQSNELQRILEKKRPSSKEASSGRMKRVEHFSYDDDILREHREGSCEGVKVVLDINGGAALRHVPKILQRLGCEVTSIGDTPSVFNRTVDPTADDLEMLSRVVVDRGAHIGLAFDSDGDRLVIVDDDGRKRSGDFMLTLALKRLLAENPGESVVSSVDTTLAVREVVEEAGGRSYESRVGEANVLETMMEKNARFGGEGSSGGLIDASFNNCRDSMVAAVTIIEALKERGAKIYDEVKSYHQSRVKMEVSRATAASIVKRLRREYPKAEQIDGVKIRPTQNSWVLVRESGTEDILRISAEARTAKEAEELAQSFVKKAKGTVLDRG